MADTPEIHEFYRGETVHFVEGPILYDGVVQDVRQDAIWLIIKAKKSDPDSAILINQPTGVAADVATDGLNGNVFFTLTKGDSDIPPATYFAERVWVTAAGEERVIPPQLFLVCKERVEDVP